MANFHVRSKVCIAPFKVRSKFAVFALHVKGSNADFALHIEGSHEDFAPHMEWAHSLRDQKLPFLPIKKNIFLVKPPISQKFYDLSDHFENENMLRESTLKGCVSVSALELESGWLAINWLPGLVSLEEVLERSIVKAPDSCKKKS